MERRGKESDEDGERVNENYELGRKRAFKS